MVCGIAALVLLAGACSSGDRPGRNGSESASGRATVAGARDHATGLSFDPPPVRGLHGGSSCGPAYTILLSGRTAWVGGCSGILPEKPLLVTVRVGSVFYIRIAHEADGGLDFPVPEPSDRRIRLVTRHGPVAQYQARAEGTSELVAYETVFCAGIDPKLGSCAAARVTVTSR